MQGMEAWMSKCRGWKPGYLSAGVEAWMSKCRGWKPGCLSAGDGSLDI